VVHASWNLLTARAADSVAGTSVALVAGALALAPIAARSVSLETVRSRKERQLFQFKRQGNCLEATEELPEPHEFTAVLRLKLGSRTEKREREFVEDHAHHVHDNTRDHGHAHGRNFAQIKELIQRSALSDRVKQKSVAVFHRIAVAEGKIHGLPPDEVHFHEVGAVDSIVDIVGACVALEMLGEPRVLAGPVVEGTGFIHCAHGRFPLPAPATLAILGARGVGVTQCDEPHELVTPTGAALLAEFARSFGPMQGLVAAKIGYGLGTRDNQTRPNVLRAILGEADSAFRSPHSALDWETDTVAVVETNLDDINAEILGHFVEKAFAKGALDVFHTPIQMKKNRPGVLLTVLCAAGDADKFSELMLRETSAPQRSSGARSCFSSFGLSESSTWRSSSSDGPVSARCRSSPESFSIRPSSARQIGSSSRTTSGATSTFLPRCTLRIRYSRAPS